MTTKERLAKAEGEIADLKTAVQMILILAIARLDDDAERQDKVLAETKDDIRKHRRHLVNIGRRLGVFDDVDEDFKMPIAVRSRID